MEWEVGSDRLVVLGKDKLLAEDSRVFEEHRQRLDSYFAVLSWILHTPYVIRAQHALQYVFSNGTNLRSTQSKQVLQLEPELSKAKYVRRPFYLKGF